MWGRVRQKLICIILTGQISFWNSLTLASTSINHSPALEFCELNIPSCNLNSFINEVFVCVCVCVRARTCMLNRYKMYFLLWVTVKTVHKCSAKQSPSPLPCVHNAINCTLSYICNLDIKIYMSLQKWEMPTGITRRQITGRENLA